MDHLEVALRLFRAWWETQQDVPLGDIERDGDVFTASAGDRKVAVSLKSLFEPATGQWQQAKAEAEQQLSSALENGTYVLWVPPEADLPLEEPGRSDFIFRAKMLAARLQAGERADLKMPVRLGVRKQDDGGSYVSVLGGLQAVWAWFTNEVSGVYTLDATALKRLPEAREEREQIVKSLVEELKTMESGQRLVLDAEDSWTLQRLSGSDGFNIMATPQSEPFVEREVRRRLRSFLTEAASELSATGTEVNILLILGLYLYASEENVTVGVRGFDPALYAPFDTVALVADGTLKPIVSRLS
ncbi:MAG: hypothetical protein GEU28_00595 [Dehalococcoidia bacterium]|nr:hypothetical protein [Dehalococcoidia bacterium]